MPTKDTGIVIDGIIVVLTFCKNTKITAITSKIDPIKVNKTSCIDSFTILLVSMDKDTSIPGGKCFLISTILAFICFETLIAFASGS